MNRILIDCSEDLTEPQWLSNVEPFLQKVVKELGFDGQEISVMFCKDGLIQQLNKEYRNIDAPTDVLSFENDEVYEDEEGRWKCVGDIVISLDTLLVNSEYFEVDINSELKRLLVHGLLHLNGMDHGEEHVQKDVAQVCEMLVLQENILEKLKDEIIIK